MMMKKLALLVVLTVALGLIGAMNATPASAFLFGGGGFFGGGGNCCPTYCAPAYCAPVCVPYCGPMYGCCYPACPPVCKGKMFKKSKMKKMK
jgi:hypothetical protein